MKNSLIPLVILLILMTKSANTATYQHKTGMIDCGSGVIISNSYQQRTSIGQLAIGTSGSNHYSNSFGYIYSVLFSTANRKPLQFSLLSPLNNGEINTLKPTFTWQPAIDLDGDTVSYTLFYEEQLERLKSSPHISKITTTYYTPSTQLNANSIYYWKVCANDGKGGITWSPVWNFKINIGTLGLNSIIIYPSPVTKYPAKVLYTIKEPCHVEISIYNIAGELIKTLVDEDRAIGGEILWFGDNQDGKKVASGVYLILFKAGSDKKVIKTAVIK